MPEFMKEWLLGLTVEQLNSLEEYLLDWDSFGEDMTELLEENGFNWTEKGGWTFGS